MLEKFPSHQNFNINSVLLAQEAQTRVTDNTLLRIRSDSLSCEALSYWITDENPIEVYNDANCLLNRITWETYVIPSTITRSFQHDKARDYSPYSCLYLCGVRIYILKRTMLGFVFSNRLVSLIMACQFRGLAISHCEIA